MLTQHLASIPEHYNKSKWPPYEYSIPGPLPTPKHSINIWYENYVGQ